MNADHATRFLSECAGCAPIAGGRESEGELIGILKLPDVSKRLESLGFEIVGSTPQQFAAYIKSEIKKWEKVVKASGAKPE